MISTRDLTAEDLRCASRAVLADHLAKVQGERATLAAELEQGWHHASPQGRVLRWALVWRQAPDSATATAAQQELAAAVDELSGDTEAGDRAMSTENMSPYENERQVLAEPMPEVVRRLHDTGQVKSGDPDRLASDTITGHLLHACENTGMDLGAYDRRVLVWLGRGETATAQVLIGLISRAYAAGADQARRTSRG